ncbi:MAG: prenyltransferase [Dehalococcoidales bacterium]|nr:prenyltransferase [Dehalococcoidales bacterium]
MKGLKYWFLETRPQFLTLTVVLAFLGTVIAWYYDYFHLGHAILAGIGLLFTHISVNTLNDYFDYRSGIDLATKRTPFSGGSGILPEKLLSPRQVLWLGLGSLILAVPIGIYFTVVSGWPLLPLLLVAAFFILLYCPLILKRPWPEWVAGAGMGTLPILGMAFVQMGSYTWEVVIAAIPSGFLVHNLLLLNEFPDAEADRQADRKTVVITSGKKSAAIFYTVVAIAVYVWIIAWVAADYMPVWTLLALITLPLTIRAINGAIHHDDPSKFMPGMAANVMVMLATQLLIGIGFVLGRVL